MSSYLKPGLPAPAPAPDGLDAPFWDGLGEGRLLIQRCDSCEGWQWGPEWICHRCHSFDLRFEETAAEGVIFSHQRVWHPVHPALAEQGAHVIVLIELPAAGGVHIVGNLVGDPMGPLDIGSSVRGVFEHHSDADPPFTLLQWERVD